MPLNVAPQDLYSYWRQNVQLPGMNAGESFPQFQDWVNQQYAGPSLPGVTNLGSDYAMGEKQFDKPLLGINPLTGRPENLYVDFGPLGGDNALGYYFESDPSKPATAQRGLAGGYSMGTDPGMSWDEMAVIAGLAAISGGAAAPAFGAVGAGAAAGATGSGIRSNFDPQATLTGAGLGAAGGAIGGSLGGMGSPDVMSNSAAGATSAGTTTAAASGGGDMWDWLDNLGGDYWMGSPDDLGVYGTSGIESAPAPDLPVPAGGGLMPPAIPEQDPTFGGELTQTGTGQYENLSNLGNDTLTGSSGWDRLLGYGSRIFNGTGGAPKGGASGGPTGNSTVDGLLGLGLGASPFLLALGLANSQGGDIDQRIRNIEGINSQFAKAQTDPYDLETGYGRAALNTDLGLRGVAGSSFGNQALNNYDVTRAMGRNDILSKALMSGYTTALGAKIQNNKNTNDLLGRGLLASANLFSPKSDPFGLNNLKEILGS